MKATSLYLSNLFHCYLMLYDVPKKKKKRKKYSYSYFDNIISRAGFTFHHNRRNIRRIRGASMGSTALSTIARALLCKQLPKKNNLIQFAWSRLSETRQRNASRSRKNNKSGSREESETRSRPFAPRHRTSVANFVASSNVLDNVAIRHNYFYKAAKNEDSRGITKIRRKETGGDTSLLQKDFGKLAKQRIARSSWWFLFDAISKLSPDFPFFSASFSLEGTSTYAYIYIEEQRTFNQGKTFHT